MLPKLDGLSLIQRAARPAHPDAGHHPQREAHRRRSGQGTRERRRRLPHQAVRVLRAARPRAGAHPPRPAAPPDADPPRRRRSGDGSARPPVTRDGREIALRPREFALLEYLMRNAGRVVSKTMILSHVWDYTLRPRHQRRRRARLPAARQDRQGLRAARCCRRSGESAMFSSPPERQRPALGLRLAIWYAAIFVASSLGADRGHLPAALDIAAPVRQRDHRDRPSCDTRRRTAQAACNGLPSRQSGVTRPARLRAALRAGGRPVPGRRCTSARRPRDAAFDLSQLEAPPPGEQTWSMLGGSDEGEPLEVASVRLPRRHALPGGQEHGPARARCFGRFRISCSSTSRRWSRIGLAGGAAFTASALRPLDQPQRDRPRDPAHRQGAVARAGRRDRATRSTSSGMPGQRDARSDRVAHRRHARRARQRRARPSNADDARSASIAETALQSRGDAAALREALADCLEESDRVVAMLNTLMDISEAETGTMRLHRERVNLDRARRAGCGALRGRSRGERRHSRKPGIRRALGRCRSDADAAGHRQPARQRAEIHAGWREGRNCDAARSNGEAILSLRDTGIGIPPDELPRIWERLYRGDKSRSERGLGLGLSLVKAIVEAHRGRVAVESEPDKGSRFVLHLPPAPNLSQL